MTESEVFESILGINEIQVDRVEWQDQSLHIYCSSIFSEALCPNCLNKRQVHRGLLWNLPCKAGFTPSRGLKFTLGHCQSIGYLDRLAEVGLVPQQTTMNHNLVGNYSILFHNSDRIPEYVFNKRLPYI